MTISLDMLLGLLPAAINNSWFFNFYRHNYTIHFFRHNNTQQYFVGNYTIVAEKQQKSQKSYRSCSPAQNNPLKWRSVLRYYLWAE